MFLCISISHHQDDKDLVKECRVVSRYMRPTPQKLMKPVNLSKQCFYQSFDFQSASWRYQDVIDLRWDFSTVISDSGIRMAALRYVAKVCISSAGKTTFFFITYVFDHLGARCSGKLLNNCTNLNVLCYVILALWTILFRLILWGT